MVLKVLKYLCSFLLTARTNTFVNIKQLMSPFEGLTDYRKNVVYLLLNINIALKEIRISSKINVITFLQTK